MADLLRTICQQKDIDDMDVSMMVDQLDALASNLHAKTGNKPLKPFAANARYRNCNLERTVSDIECFNSEVIQAYIRGLMVDNCQLIPFGQELELLPLPRFPQGCKVSSDKWMQVAKGIVSQ